MKKFFRKLHRWLGLLMALQIIAWMASGLYFSLIPISEIRGEHLTRAAGYLDSGAFQAVARPERIEALLDEQFGDSWNLKSFTLVNIAGRTSWRIEIESGGETFRRLLAADGSRLLLPLSENQARATAKDWLLAAVEPVAVDWIEQAAADSEIRGRDLPLWKVDFAQPEAVSLYLHPWTGELLARRTDSWRIFDFFWMLHIMDFDSRDNFNHPLLQLAAALGLVIALSGVVFWALTSRLFRRRRTPA
jgi:uncharacterized iron-regulated membrane protein